ncbi:hypothetical protein JX265_005059 [Neoarthrinium moseri]|uniref:Polyketide synthase n=1 Tax=Neoarthrinium moseri TaxID=1658444 RepID=A0A9P9WP35_9PEZI|nr:hypothetical protein JX265_005059 [Neoarthrinium moseri]
MEGPKGSSTPIAVVGMSCKFAGDATSPEKFWELLAEGRSAWSPIPESRFNLGGVYHANHENIGTTNVRGGHFLKADISQFDAAFFNFSAETAATMDPQFRLQLESVYEALESAGIPLQQIAGSNTSVFAGSFFHDYQDSHMRDPTSLPRFLVTGNGAAMAANRISHFYDLRGPSMTIDTGCSTTLTAVHQACQSLKTGEVDTAIVGGSNLMINSDNFAALGSLGFLSPDGKSYSFDSRGNGYGRGEGVATVVLKRLDDALRAGDPVRAVIRETCLNQDGKTETITSPSQQAQEELIRKCYRKAGLGLGAVQYFEAHGTGTPTGDPIELGAAAAVFQHSRSAKEPLLIGSVKSNIGHTETVSGLASLIKVALALERGEIPPSINFERPNKRLKLDEWNFKVPQKCEEWHAGVDGNRRASLSNFGYGGTNAHVIMEDLPHQIVHDSRRHLNGNGYTNGDRHSIKQYSRVFLLSAKDEQACRMMVENLKKHLQRLVLSDEDDNEYLDSLAYTLGQRRTLFPWVSAYRAGDIPGLIQALDNPRIQPTRSSDPKPRVGFVFTGQGAQWHAMGRELLDAYPLFKTSILEADKYLREFGADWSLLEELLRDADTSRVGEVSMSTPLCVAVQISLVRLMESWGVLPCAVCSHSSGEVASAYTAGVLSFRSAMAVSYCRGGVASVPTTGHGGMLAIGVGRDVAEHLLKHVKSGRANVACINSPSSVTLSGDLTAIDELEAIAKEKNLFARRLRVGTAFHSHHMLPGSDAYRDQMRLVGVGKAEPEMRHVRYASPTTGTLLMDAASISNPDHWVESLLRPVQFVDAFREMAYDQATEQTTVDVVIEVGPHAALSGPIGDILTLPEFRGTSITYLSCLIRKSNAIHTMHALVGQLKCQGIPVDLDAVNFPLGKHSVRVLSNLPTYPWTHLVQHWSEPRVNKSRREKKQAPHDLVGSLQDGTNVNAPTWKHIIRTSELPWVREHTVQSNMVYPAAGFICMAIEAARQVAQTSDIMKVLGYRLRDVDIQQALVIPESSDGIEVQTTLRPVSNKAIGVRGWKAFQISSVGLDSKWTDHCQGLVQVALSNASDEQDHWSTITSSSGVKSSLFNSRDIHPEDMYAGMQSVSICYGPLFQNLESIQSGERQSLSTLTIADVRSKMPSNHQQEHVIHPTTLDSVFVSAYTALPEAGTEFHDSAKVPKTIDSLWVSHHISSQVGHRFQARSQIQRHDSKGFQSDIHLVDVTDNMAMSETPVLVVQGLACQSLGAAIPRQPETYKREICATMNWGPDFAFMEADVLKRRLLSCIEPKETEFLAKIRRACFHFLHDSLEGLTLHDVQTLSTAHKKFYVWMKLQVQQGLQGDLGPGSAAWVHDSIEQKQRLFDEVAAANVKGEMLCRLGSHIAAILSREASPLNLVTVDNLQKRYHEEETNLGWAGAQLSELIRNFVHHNPQAKILETGVGTGEVTKCVLEVLGNGAESGFGPLASEYHFTHVSPAPFDAIQQAFEAWSSIISCRRLDTNADPVQQGFELGSYDLIIAFQISRSYRHPDVSIANMRSLLRPGGKLLLLEAITDQLDVQLALGLGLLPATVPSVSNVDDNDHSSSRGQGSPDDENNIDKAISPHQWDQLLMEAGFTGIDLEIYDGESRELSTSTIMLSTVQADRSLFAPVVLVSNGQSLEENWLRELQHSIAAVTGGSVPVVESINSVHATGCVCVFLGEIHHSILSKPSAAEFSAIKSLVLNCNGLLWITRGGAVEGNDPWLALSQGFLRSLRNEYSGKRYVSLDLDSHRSSLGHEDVSAITRVLATCFDDSVPEQNAPRDFDFAERDGVILTPRLYKDFERNSYIAADPSQSKTPQLEPFHQTDRPLKLEVATPGLLETLVFSDHLEACTNIAPEFIEVEPRTMALNFRDVMVAMGQLNETRMGYECAGVITGAGTSAISHGYQVGDRVFCLLNGQFASRVRLPWTTAYHMPPDMAFETAASIPMVFATAYTSLYDIARLGKGQTVLIHAAAGGVGQAAIILAQLVGAEVYATAGTDEKRSFIINKYNLPVDHVFSSRDASFAPKLKSMTKNGVDVVLNCLSGRLLQESFNCLAPYGHFVEIGKYDLEQNSYLELKQFSRVASFSSVDMSVLLQDRPSEIHRVLASVARLLEQKAITAVEPITVFPLPELEKAFRQMQAGKHIGKIVVSIASDITVPVVQRQPVAKLRPDFSYLIVGGVRGIGKSIARWMLSRGGKSIILLSRSANSTGAVGAFVAELEKEYPGSRVKSIGCDITSDADLSLALQHCAKEFPPIRGVIQGAMVIEDSILEQMTVEQFNAAVSPKVQGTWNLHNLLGSELDFFVMLSSLAGIIGYASSSNYTAGGTFQDALAKYRVAKGLPAVALDLGVVKGIGKVATEKSAHERMTRHGHLPLSEAQVLAAVESAIVFPSSQVMVGFNTGPGKHWDESTGSPLARELRFSALQPRKLSQDGSNVFKSHGGTDSLAGKLAAASSIDEGADLILQALKQKLVDIFMVPIEEIAESKSMAGFGVDSLVAVELRNMLALQAGSEVSIFDIMQSPSLLALSKTVASTSIYVLVSL